MRVLYINHYAGSPRHGMEFRPFYLSREWLRAGHHVHIVAASYSHVRAHQPSGGERPLEEVIEGVRYTWMPSRSYAGNGIGRVLNIAQFLAGVWRRRRSLADERPDVVIASSTYPLDIWVARSIARLAGAKLVYEVHDLWPLSPIELGGMSPKHPFIQLCQRAEDVAYRDSDAVVSMLPCVHEHMAARGLRLNRLHLVPNGIDPEEWEGEGEALPPELAALLDELRAAGRVIVGYSGSHGAPNALDVMLDAAKLVDPERFAFVAVGDGHEKARLAARLSDEGIANVWLWPPVAKASIREFLRCIDIAYIGWQRIGLYRFGISPNKLMDYMMAEKVVLHSVAAGNDPVADAGCGLTVPPMDPAAVAGGLTRLADLDPRERAQMGARGRKFVMAHHSYPTLADNFMKAVTG